MFARPPYQRYQYYSGGFVVMQLALTYRTGQFFANGMKAAVLAPLGMGEPAPSMHLCSEALSGSSVAGLD